MTLRTVPKDGYLREWLYIGPYASKRENAWLLESLSLRTLRPAKNRMEGSCRWDALSSDNPVVDIIACTPHWPDHLNCHAFFHLYVYSFS